MTLNIQIGVTGESADALVWANNTISIILNLKVNQESTYLEQDLLDKVLNYLQQLTTSKNILLHIILQYAAFIIPKYYVNM